MLEPAPILAKRASVMGTFELWSSAEVLGKSFILSSSHSCGGGVVGWWGDRVSWMVGAGRISVAGFTFCDEGGKGGGAMLNRRIK